MTNEEEASILKELEELEADTAIKEMGYGNVGYNANKIEPQLEK
jgi:hypothetical protein